MSASERAQKRAHEILLYIASRSKDNPPNKYQICRAPSIVTIGSEPTILATINQLEFSGNIHVVKTDRKARGPKRSSKHYGLTALGLAKLISQLDPDKDSKFFNDLAEKYKGTLPRIFDLWDQLSRLGTGVGKVARERLICIAEMIAAALKPDFMRDPTVSKDVREGIIRGVLTEATDMFWDPASQLHLHTSNLKVKAHAGAMASAWEIIPGKNRILETRSMEAIIRCESLRIGSRVRQFKNLGADRELQDIVQRYKQILDKIWGIEPHGLKPGG